MVDEAEIENASLDLAAGIASNAPLSMRGNKQTIETLLANPVLTDEQEKELEGAVEGAAVSVPGGNQ